MARTRKKYDANSPKCTLVNLRGSVSFKCSKFLFMQGHSVKMVYCQYLGIGVEGKEFSFTQS